MHGYEVATETVGEAPSADSDDALADCVYEVLGDVDGVTSLVRSAAFGTGEHAAWLMNAVSDAGGSATHVVVSTDHPVGHYTPTLDVDERSVNVGAAVIAGAATALAGDER